MPLWGIDSFIGLCAINSQPLRGWRKQVV